MTKKVVVIDTEGDGLSHDATIFHVMGWTYDGLTVETTHSEFHMKCMLEEWYVDDYKIVIHNAMRHDVALFMRLLDIHLPVSSYVDTLALSWTLNHDKPKHGLGEYGEHFGVPKPDVEFWSIQEGQTQDEFQEIMRNRVTEDVKINWMLWKQIEGKLGELYGTI
jgi:DNA polymerase III alpha subunit (gram-positive type)